ncbi:MAG: hypothetical protein AB1801_09550 [Chloroflexota bacterium]
MILHRRIHKFVPGKFDEGVVLAKEFDRLGRAILGSQSKLYVSSMWGGAQPRPRLIVDTEHENLAAMEKYYQRFFELPAVQQLLPQWQAVEAESWAENYELLSD